MDQIEAKATTDLWYKCRNDLMIVFTAHLVLMLFLIVAGYDRIGGWSQKIVHWFFIKSLFPIFVYIEWSMWLYAITFAIIAFFLCLGHYWKWSLISWVSLSVIGAYSIGLYGFNKLSLSWFIQGTVTLALIHLPVFVCISVIIYLGKKKNRERIEKG